jgi:hypothetical protein
LLVEGLDDADDIVVGEEFPHAIRGYHYEFVLVCQVHLEDFRFCDNSYLGSTMVSERSRHGQPRYVFIEMPNTRWPNIPASLVLERFDPPSIGHYPLVLVRLIRLVVAVQREPLDLARGFHLPGKDSPGVSDVRAEYLVAHDEDGDTCGPAEVYVYARIRIEALISGLERLCQRILNLVGVHHTLLRLRLVKDVLDFLLHLGAQRGTDELRYFFPEESMSIADCEEVRPSILSKVGHGEEGILIHLVGVRRLEACFRCESEFGDTIIEFGGCLWLRCVCCGLEKSVLANLILGHRPSHVLTSSFLMLRARWGRKFYSVCIL